MIEFTAKELIQEIHRDVKALRDDVQAVSTQVQVHAEEDAGNFKRLDGAMHWLWAVIVGIGAVLCGVILKALGVIAS